MTSKHMSIAYYAGDQMTQTVKRAEQDQLRFEIVEDNPDVGFYLYVYEGNRCIADYLQNDEEMCKLCAYEEYGVEPSLWQEVPQD